MNESQGIQSASVSIPASPRRVPPQKPNKPAGLAAQDVLAATQSNAQRPASPTLSDALTAPGSVVTPTPSVRAQDNGDAVATETATDKPAAQALKEKAIGWFFKAAAVAKRVQTWAHTPAGETAIYGACTVAVAVCSATMLALCSGAALIAPAVGLAAAVVLGLATFLSFRTMQNAKASVAA